ncbi:MAG: 2-oxoacid:acceptor oxidoreductase subunit alpha [Methanoregulaceae archaeon]
MRELSVLIGGKAGDGINSAGLLICQILGSLGYRVYMYYDYPSLIRGGHNFAVVRASEEPVGTHRDRVDVIIALNQETLDRHRDTMKPETVVIANRDLVKSEGTGIPVQAILAQEKAPPVMGNTCLVGAFAKAAGVRWEELEPVIRRHLLKGTDLNLKVARRGYDLAPPGTLAGRYGRAPDPILTGNEAVGLGLLLGGLEAYVSYPMTPSSSLLHFLAGLADEFGLKVIHPENEIAVILMAQGLAYAGKRTAVGTSGGGFCLMTEGLSMAGMAEIPVVILLGQRTGPSTGLPTYSGQTELNFTRFAGQGEFPRLIVAPGDPEQAVLWSQAAMNIAWEYQVPAFILSDKNLAEGTYSLREDAVPRTISRSAPGWDGTAPYRRYALTGTGISPLAFPPRSGAIVKANSYAHDEDGITTEEPAVVAAMTAKREKKRLALGAAVGKMEGAVVVSGDPAAATAILCWGSNAGVSREVARDLGMRVIQPVVLEPFPFDQYRCAMEGVRRVIAVEDNCSGQLAGIVQGFGFPVDAGIHRVDGRPYTCEDLTERVREAAS